MRRNECPLQNVDVYSFIFDFSGDKTQPEIDQIKVAKGARVSNLLSCHFTVFTICHKLHLKRHLRSYHHI